MDLCDYDCCPREVRDWFCGAGGAAMGLHRAWPHAHIVGYDLKPQPRYPFEFVQGVDALEAPTGDFTWASPPCQEYSVLHALHPDKHYPDLVAPTRVRLLDSGCQWAMENVIGAPFHYAVMLCGAMFPPMRTYRHRLFETSDFLFQPPHPRHVVPSNRRKQHRKEHFQQGGFLTVAGNAGRYASSIAMLIDWMTGDELSQAVPPAYSQWIATQVPLPARVGRAA